MNARVHHHVPKTPVQPVLDRHDIVRGRAHPSRTVPLIGATSAQAGTPSAALPSDQPGNPRPGLPAEQEAGL